MTTQPAQPLSLDQMRIGRLSRRSTISGIILFLIAAWGVYAYTEQLRNGLIATSLRTIGRGGAGWGLYVSFDVYFVGLSFAGISIAAMIRLFALRTLEPMARMAELLAIVSLLMGGLCILADLGRPLDGLLSLPRYARPTSPFFGTFTLVVAGYLFASLVYFFLAGRADAAACAERFPRFRWAYGIWASGYRGTPAEKARHHRATFWLSLAILPLLVTAHSTLGLVFGIQGGRPGWFSALQAPSFVVLAGASGTAMLIMIAAGIRWLMGLEDVLEESAFRMLGNFLWTLTLTYLYLMLIDELTANYAASAADAHVAHQIVFGPYAWMFWTTFVFFAVGALIPFLHFVRGRAHIGWAVVAAALVNLGSILKRLLITVPSQTDGMLLPYPAGHYVPSWVEVSVVAGLLALAGFVFLVFSKLFPIVPIVSMDPEGPEAAALGGLAKEKRGLRAVIFWSTLAAGLSLAVVGFLLSLRFGTLHHLDPVVPYSPVLFAAGVMLTFYSAAAYETFPPPRRSRRQ